MMNCYLHPDQIAIGSCSSCGRAICSECAVEMQGRLVCRECLSAGRVRQPGTRTAPDPNTAYMLELIGGLFGFLGLGYFYIGQTGDGIIRLVGWMIYNIIAYIVIGLLMSFVIGFVCCPFQLIIQIGVPIWSAAALKKKLIGG